MGPLTRAAIALAALASLSACASAPAPRDTFAGIDSAGTVWGDEYEGQPVETESPVNMARGLRAEWVEGATRSARVDGFAGGASVLLRSSRTGEVGSISWRGAGVVREIAAGDVMPAVAEGALVGDRRTSADLRAPTTADAEGLRMETSSSPYAARRGAGVVLALGSYRLGLGGCEARHEAEDRAGLASIEWRRNGMVVGAAAGAAARGASSHAAGSWYAARDDGVSFASGEVAVAGGSVRSIARLVAGERREWSAIAIAGAGPAREEELVFARRERWGAALERRDGWSWGACRTGVSSLTRRDVDTDVRRRRAFWDGVWRLSDGARFELAARITRETSERAAGGALTALPAHDTHGDWRARATLRAERASEAGWRVENAYRLEWVQNRSGRPGTIATWTCRLRAGDLDARLCASAHALNRGQVAYSPDAAPLGTGEYTAVVGKGAALAGTLRVWLGSHAWLGATWSKRPPAASSVWVSVGLRT